MNGPLSMYKLKPVVSFSGSVETTPSMYRMKKIINSSNNSSLAGGMKEDSLHTLPNVLEQKPASQFEKLEQRQKAILKQLSFLKDQMSVLREEYLKKNSEKTSSKDNISTFHQGVTEQSWKGAEDEVVVNASPDWPPYSLLAVCHLWPGIRVRITCHAHSSVKEESLLGHLEVFSFFADTQFPHIHIRLIWKQMNEDDGNDGNDGDCEMVISPLTHCPIRGEVNILRYLHRSISASADPVTETQLDSLLDACHRLRHADTLHTKQLAVRALNARLGKDEWLGGQKMSVADAAAWSVFISIRGVELSQNMTKWKSRCEAAIGQEESLTVGLITTDMFL